ncbi:hypothetical protein BBJ29_007789 [Phytophthora kernoviae]|uniref:Helicase ATP-binding domain-containing protein n=1 Tax=Phytophthora kernoviae TaxID=325452 RepID=A0A3F2RT86_9STRA|nr:hypothetical protein BBP00_00003858 [Phytophthora kernoviae]RLN68352.1 hypothetical protein BBJ29_007789 [Phytophthora kernoviae]
MKQVELRAFQHEILELAREKNVVMVGDTGIGKTFLAIALLNEQDYSGDKRAFFMAPTRQLVVQITAKIRQTSTLRVNSYCGSTADLWDAAQWERELLLTRVFVCTPEIVRNVLLKGYVTLDRMNLLVFDECHHVTKRHPYAQVIKMYSQAEPASMPRIFGTTACPTRHCAEKLHAELKKVELDKAQIAEFAAAAPMLFETYSVQAPWSLGGDEEEEKKEKEVGGKKTADSAWVFSNVEKELEEVKAIAVYIKLTKKGKSDAATDAVKLEKAKKKFVQSCFTVYKNLGPWCYYRYLELEITRLAIAASLLITIPGNSRLTWDEDPQEQLFASILGRASRSDTASFQLPKMESTLSKFESGAVRILVSTAVSVEGVDFPQCGLIVVLDRIGTGRMLMQLKGRARHEDGIVYYLAEEGDLAHHVHYEQLVREGEVINKLEFSREKVETIQQQPRSVAAQMMGEMYKIEIESTGAVLDLDSSIPCINQFCQSLPDKLFTVNSKKLYTTSENRYGSKLLFVAELNLPPELNLESFCSTPMTSKSSARAAAAFSACQKLLDEGLLDDSLNSVYRTTKVKASANARDLSYFLNRLHT